MSCTRHTERTRAILPAGSSTSIAYEAGSTKSVESARYGISAPGRGPYALATAASESSTTPTVRSVVSISTSRRRVPSFTSTRPSGSSRTWDTEPSGSVETAEAVVIACTGGPAERGGAGPGRVSPWASAAEGAAAARAMHARRRRRLMGRSFA